MLLISYAPYSNHSWHIYLSSIIRVETVTPDQKECEHELEIVGDDASIETQGRHLSIFCPLFWINQVYVSCLRMSYRTLSICIHV